MQPILNLLQTSEAARILEVSAGTVRHLERVGQLRALKTAKGVRLFDRVDVERLALRRATKGGTEP
jgi:excisionase family DNA binding protein